MAENIKIIGVKTASELDVISKLEQETIFVCNDNNTLMRLSYNTLSNDLTSQITGYTHSTYQPISDMTSYTKLSTFNNKSNALSREIDSLSTALSNDIKLSVQTILSSSIPIAQTDVIGGIKLYDDSATLEDNKYKLQLNADKKAYVEINDLPARIDASIGQSETITSMNSLIQNLDNKTTAISGQINDITSQIDQLCSKIDNIDASILRNDVNDLSNSVLDLIESNTYMFGAFMRNSYLSLSADSTGLYGKLQELHILDIIDPNDQTTYNNLRVYFVFNDNIDNKLNYSISASTVNNAEAELKSETVIITNSTTSLSVLDFGTANDNLVQLECKVDSETFTKNGIDPSSAIKFLKDDNFKVRFVKDAANNNNAILQFDDFAEGDKNGYLFIRISAVENTVDSSITNLSNGTGDIYESLSAKIYRDLSSQFVYINDTRAISINSLSANTISANTISATTYRNLQSDV